MSVPSNWAPLQENMFYSGGEHAVMIHPHTGVNVDRKMPRDHFIWSLICCMYFNPFCLGLLALISSVKARDRMLVGDIEGAGRYGRTARSVNLISTVMFFVALVIGTVLFYTFFPSYSPFDLFWVL